jgi:hypothetical protein
VILEIKTNKLTHQDLGQLQMYVNYFDRYEKQPNEHATIGIILCADKDHLDVEIALQDIHKPIGVGEYQLLPKDQLERLIVNAIKGEEQ